VPRLLLKEMKNFITLFNRTLYAMFTPLNLYSVKSPYLTGVFYLTGLFALCAMLYTTPASPQTRKIDSLKALLNSSKIKNNQLKDTTKIKTLNRLSSAHLRTGEYDQALDYAHRALSLAKPLPFKETGAAAASAFNNIGIIYAQQGNYPKALQNYNLSLKLFRKLGDLPAKALAQAGKAGEARTIGYIGIIYAQQGNYPKALQNYNRSLKLSRKLGDKAGEARSFNNIGIVYDNQGNYAKALQNYNRSLKLFRKFGDKAGEARTFNNIGIIYWNQGNYPKALQNYNRSLKLKRKLGDKAGEAFTINNIGIIYYEQGNYPKALQNYNRSLKLSRKLGDKAGEAGTLGNIGVLYTTLPDSVQGLSGDSIKSLYKKAMALQQKYLEITKQIGHASYMTYALLGIGNILNKQHRYAEAIAYLEQSRFLADSIGAKPLLMDSYEGLSTSTFKLRRFETALEYYKKYTKLKEEIFSEEKQKELGRQEMVFEYELELIEKEQNRQERERAEKKAKKWKNNVQYASIAVGLILFSFLLIRFGRGRLKSARIRALILLMFMFVFEFILVLLEPLIEQYSGDAPVLILLMNVGVALMLLPFHRLLEGRLVKWMKKGRRKRKKGNREIGE